jgi:NitT/TauT family transport system substrate-binding protein
MRKMLAVAATLCAVALVGACGGQAATSGGAGPTASNLTPIPLRLPVTAPTPATLPVYVAVEKGFLAEQGFEPSYLTVSSGAAMLPALTAGQADVVSSSLSTLVKLRQSQSVTAVAGLTTGLNYFVLVRKGASIPTTGTFEEKMRSLNGKVIGAQGGADGTVVPFLKAMASAGGGDPATLNIPNLAFGGPQIAALQSGQVDAVLADDSTLATATQLGLGTSVFSLLNDPPAQYKGLLTSVFVATGDTLNKYPDFAERFHAAMDKTYAWIKDPANADDLRSVATKAQGLPDSPDLSDRLKVLGTQLTIDGSRSVLDKSMSFLFDSGQVPAQPRVTTDEFFGPVMIASG